MRSLSFSKPALLVLLIILIPATQLLKGQTEPSLSVTRLKTQYYSNPVGIDRLNPRFSWVIESELQGTLQTAWQIQSATSREQLEKGNLEWDSGKVPSGSSIHNRWEGPALQSGQRYFWRVRVWDNHDNFSAWSEVGYWETGLLKDTDWLAEWIEPNLDEDTMVPQPSPMLRSEFDTRGSIVSARAYLTAHGVYEMHINGRRVGQELFTPGWTSYHNRLQYQTYDITGYLKPGKNAVGVYLGDGWFRGFIGWGDQRNYYRENLALLAQIEITYQDGTKQVFGTDKNWKSSTGPILRSDIYNGEYYDARLEKPGWTSRGYNDNNWKGMVIFTPTT